MKTPAYSEAAAVEAARRTLLAPGWIDAVIREAVERSSARGNEMIEIDIAVPDGRGGERLLKDYLTGTSSLGALRLRHACESIHKLDRYDAGEVSASDFVGHTVRVKIGVEKKRSYAPRNIIEDYAASEANVSSLRGVAS
jgi:hypothetical protein